MEAITPNGWACETGSTSTSAPFGWLVQAVEEGGGGGGGGDGLLSVLMPIDWMTQTGIRSLFLPSGWAIESASTTGSTAALSETAPVPDEAINVSAAAADPVDVDQRAVLAPFGWNIETTAWSAMTHEGWVTESLTPPATGATAIFVDSAPVATEAFTAALVIGATFVPGEVPVPDEQITGSGADTVGAVIDEESEAPVPLEAMVATASTRRVVLNLRKKMPDGSLALPTPGPATFAFWDEARPDLLTAPTQKGACTIAADGSCTIDLPGTQLGVNSVGYITVSSTSGAAGVQYNHFSGPVTLA
jgi:hypothetical protein